MKILGIIGGVCYMLLAGMTIAGAPNSKWFIALSFILLALYIFKAGLEE